jgi:predicted permease
VVLSHLYWIRRFGMDSNVVGKGITINGVPFTVAGIAPAGFRDLSRRGLPDPPDVAIPLMHEPRVRGDNSMLGTPAAWWLTVIGRRAPGATIPQIEANLEGVLIGVVEAYVPGQTPEDRARLQIPRLRVVAAGRGLADPSPEVMTRFLILATIALIVLLVVCVNVANLLLSRSLTREREIAVRRAIGASRARIATQLLTEALVLAGVAGAVALPIAFASGSLLGAVVGDSGRATALDTPTLAFAGMLSMATAMLFGAIPAIRATGTASASGIRQGAGSFPAPACLGKSLLIAQVALSFPLLVAAGLFLRTLVNLEAVEIGFDPENIVLFTLEPELSGYDRPRGTVLYERIEERLLRVPGVRSVTTSAFGSSLMDGGGVVMSMGGEAEAPTLAVDQNFFATLGIALKRGRMFAPSDTATSTRVAIVNETFAKRFFPDADPIGKSFRAGFQFEVIGVVADARVNSLREPPPPTIYRTITQLPLPGRRVIVRTAADAAALIPAIREAMRDVDPNLPLQNVSTQVDSIEARYLVTERMFAATSSAVGGLVLAVTMIGLFGLMSYTVTRRTKELGIRVALGAQRSQVLRPILADALIVVGAGVLVGLAAALAIGRLLETLIFGLSRHDPLSLSLAAMLMFVAATVAGYFPARRATRVDPVVALRAE